MNREEVLQIIGLVKARYGNKFEHNTATEEMWCMVLDDVPLEPCKPILAAWFKDEEWPPDPSVIRNRLLETAGGLPSGEEAWLMVLDRIKATYPGFDAPPWIAPEPVLNTVKKIGFRNIRMTEKPEEMRKRFIKLYDTERRELIAERTLADGLNLGLGTRRVAIDG